MRGSRDRILTSHAGSLPRPDELIEANQAREAGGRSDEAAFRTQLRSAVGDVVRRQQELGIDVPGDGEFGKAMGSRVNYRAWWSYSFHRLEGLELGTTGLYDMPARRSPPGEVVLTSFADRRDRLRFAAAYGDPDSGVSTGPRAALWPVCVGPLTYTGHEAIRADIANLKAAMDAAGVAEGFMTSIAPGSASRIGNAHYKTEDEFLLACAEAMREEYKAIVDAGLVLQLDDPAIAENWDMVNPEPTAEDYRRFSMVRVEALNHALRGLPEDRIRFHLCWGSWHGPHTTDIPLRDIVDVMLAVKCQAYSFEAANVRHEHEWRVWQDVRLPEGKLILPGIVSHATNLVEPPELVAERQAQPYTMTDKNCVLVLIHAVRYVVKNGIPGSLVECGVWKGGSMMSVARTLLNLGVDDRELLLFATFEGMTAPTDKDTDHKQGAAMREFREKVRARARVRLVLLAARGSAAQRGIHRLPIGPFSLQQGQS